MIHCQNCTTRNALTRQFCWKCGWKLLVPSRTGKSESPMGFMDEHVLERISSLEHALSTINKRLDTLAETVERVAANSFIDHTMIETLTDSLESAGVNLPNLESEWRKKIDARLLENEEVEGLGTRMEEIIDLYRGSRRNQFTMWMERAYELLASDRTTESLHSLESAYEHDPANYELGMLLAEAYFQSAEFGRSSECLRRVLDTKPDHFEATLLMGLLQKKNGNYGESQRLLEQAVALRNDSPSAHATLGSLLLEGGNSQRARDHLSRALELQPLAPIHFMLGATYYAGGRQRRAIDHLKQATQLDPEFGEAFYQMGLLCLEMNWRRKAQKCFSHAQQIDPEERRYYRMVPSFSDARATPDQLTGLVRDELRLTNCWSAKRAR